MYSYRDRNGGKGTLSAMVDAVSREVRPRCTARRDSKMCGMHCIRCVRYSEALCTLAPLRRGEGRGGYGREGGCKGGVEGRTRSSE